MTLDRHAPAQVRARVRGVDVARAVALIGMMGTHLLAEDDAAGRVTPWFWVAAGRSSGLFALLAGVGLALATGGPQPRLRPWPATAARITTRAALVAALGLALVSLDPPVAVILTNYGVLFVLALPLLGLRPRALLLLAAAWGTVIPLASHVWRSGLPTGPGEQVGFGDLSADGLVRLLLTGYYPVLTWLAYLMVGLALGRLDLLRAAVAARVALAGAACAAVAWALSWLLLAWRGWAALVAAGPADVVRPLLGPGQLELRGRYGTAPTTTWWWQAVVSPHTGTPFDLLQTTGSALLTLGTCLLACAAVERVATRSWARLPTGALEALARTGSMTLTLYSLHVVVATHQQDVTDRRTLLLGHVAVAVLLAAVWRERFRRGPVEQVVHTLSAGAGRAARRACGAPAAQPG